MAVKGGCRPDNPGSAAAFPDRPAQVVNAASARLAQPRDIPCDPVGGSRGELILTLLSAEAGIRMALTSPRHPAVSSCRALPCRARGSPTSPQRPDRRIPGGEVPRRMVADRWPCPRPPALAST